MLDGGFVMGVRVGMRVVLVLALAGGFRVMGWGQGSELVGRRSGG
jgi:hypothetical protein